MNPSEKHWASDNWFYYNSAYKNCCNNFLWNFWFAMAIEKNNSSMQSEPFIDLYIKTSKLKANFTTTSNNKRCLSIAYYKNVTGHRANIINSTAFFLVHFNAIIWLNAVSNLQRHCRTVWLRAPANFKLLSGPELEAKPTAATCLQRSIIYDFLSTSDDYLNVYFNIKYNIAAHYLIICLHVSFKLLPPWKSSFCPPPRLRLRERVYNNSTAVCTRNLRESPRTHRISHMRERKAFKIIIGRKARFN